MVWCPHSYWTLDCTKVNSKTKRKRNRWIWLLVLNNIWVKKYPDLHNSHHGTCFIILIIFVSLCVLQTSTVPLTKFRFLRKLSINFWHFCRYCWCYRFESFSSNFSETIIYVNFFFKLKKWFFLFFNYVSIELWGCGLFLALSVMWGPHSHTLHVLLITSPNCILLCAKVNAINAKVVHTYVPI